MPDTVAHGEGWFALGTFSAGDLPFVGLVYDGQVLDLGSVHRRLGVPPNPTVRDLLDQWDTVLPALVALTGEHGGGRYTEAELTTHAPLAPRQVLQSGANYRTNVIDLALAYPRPDDPRSLDEVHAQAEALLDQRAAEGTPYLFIGLPSAVAGPYDDLVLPAYSEQHDWELELAAVIGRVGFRVSPERALDHVAGFTIVNDVTTRDLVLRRDMPESGPDWFRAKNAPGFLPTGPYVVPSHCIGDPMELQLRLELNGKAMQQDKTQDMIFPVSTLVATASEITPLQPGDLILTGSPAGNGRHWGRPLRDGDIMVATITGLGTQRIQCVTEPVPGC